MDETRWTLVSTQGGTESNPFAYHIWVNPTGIHVAGRPDGGGRSWIAHRKNPDGNEECLCGRNHHLRLFATPEAAAKAALEDRNNPLAWR